MTVRERGFIERERENRSYFCSFIEGQLSQLFLIICPQQDTRERRFPNRPQQVVALRPVVDDLSRDHPFQRLLGGDKNLRPFEAVSETKRRYLSLLF